MKRTHSRKRTQIDVVSADGVRECVEDGVLNPKP
jgi:hypothetical protein